MFKHINMLNRSAFHLVLTALCLFSFLPRARSQQLLWQLGKPDNDIQEFALAPGSGDKFQQDGLFVVGRSTEKKDWPFSHPGPDDAWAGSRAHTFSIVFGLADPSRPGQDSCSLQFKLADVGPSNVRLDITVNGQLYHARLPKGAGTAIFGDVKAGKPYAFNLSFPAAILRKGDNVIDITTGSGSWFIYDWVGLKAPAALKLRPVLPAVTLTDVIAQPFLSRKSGHNYQSALLSFFNTGDSASVTVNIPGLPLQQLGVATGNRQIEIDLPEVTTDSSVALSIVQGKKTIAARTIALRPVRKMTIYILPHSHNDIGYTEIQSKVENKQLNNLLKGIDFARRTRDYPEGARFVWNLEGSYAADLFLERMGDQQKQDFYAAVRDGGVALNGMYVNTLTGLCRPEELLNLFKVSADLGAKCNVKVDAAMISDVPGYTWGTVSAMAQAGIKYFSAAPNYFDRIGDILQKWEDKPFYWVSPSGKEKVLVWIPYKGYALSHGLPGLSASFVTSYMQQMEKIKYPYEINYVRWSGHGDNAEPEIAVSDFVKDWSSKYIWPKFIIASTSTAFSAFERVYGSSLPSVQGDWTGYWEDGAASSAVQTTQNRASSSQLSQAEALWAIRKPEAFPVRDFHKAWQQVILYSEHTWGAYCSVTDPLSPITTEQWAIKKSYADTARDMAGQLLAAALTTTSSPATTASGLTTTNGSTTTNVSAPAGVSTAAGAIDVYNTNSWPRKDLVLVSPQLSAAGDEVKDATGTVIPSQRLSTGELAFVATDIPPYAAKRYFIGRSPRRRGSSADLLVSGNSLDNGILHVTIDATTGAIKSLRNSSIDNNFADSATGDNLNDYLFLHGANLADLKRNGPVTITVKERGPVVATLSIVSDAPGCNKLTREVRLISQLDRVDMTNILDKKAAELNPHPGDYPWANTQGKESVNFGFPFHVTDGAIRLDIPMAVMRPELDQIPSACKNWVEAGGWADVSNGSLGITWATPDAPLVEVGGITATLLGGQTNPDVWRKKIEPTQKLYSWALNNHWETNYRASQEGIIILRYALRPHGGFDPAAAAQFSAGMTQPLIVAAAAGAVDSISLLRLSSKNIVVLALKPSDDGKARLVTLYNPTAGQESTSLSWSVPVKSSSYSNTTEVALQPLTGDVVVAPQEVVTIRVEK
jgi:hypothetical protein